MLAGALNCGVLFLRYIPTEVTVGLLVWIGVVITALAFDEDMHSHKAHGIVTDSAGGGCARRAAVATSARTAAAAAARTKRWLGARESSPALRAAWSMTCGACERMR